MKQTIQWKNKSIQIDIGLILILILFGMTSCFALYNSFNLIKFGSGSSYLYRQLFWFIVGFVAMFFLSILQNKKIYSYMDMAYKILMLCLVYLFFSRLLFNFIELTHLCMDKSIIAYPLKILVSIEIFDLKVPFFTIFLYIGYGPLTQWFHWAGDFGICGIIPIDSGVFVRIWCRWKRLFLIYPK